MIPRGLLPIANHLWQSTLCAVIAGLLTLVLRNNRAHARYCLWLAASAKFLIPFSLLVAVGNQVGRHAATAPAPSEASLIIAQLNDPFGSEVTLQQPRSSHQPESERLLLPLLVFVWTTGTGVLALSWWRQWRRIHGAIRDAARVPIAISVPVLSSASFFEPGVFGVFRPVLLLPDGIATELAPAELKAVLAHELSHVRRRDNLITFIHMVVETVFWFHPLVWWLGARLMAERERACDDEVLQMGSEPEAYAEGILKVCELYLRSPLKFAAGITGADLKARIEVIMGGCTAQKLTSPKKLLLAGSAVLAVAMPIAVGIVNVPIRLHAQVNLSPLKQFEVASVKPNTSGREGFSISPSPGNYSAKNVTVMRLITSSFRLQNSQVIGGPTWLGTARFDVVAKAAGSSTSAELSLMVQRLLTDRFKLAFHMETRELPIYALTVAKNGPKLRNAEDGMCADAIKASQPCVKLNEFKNGLVAANLSLANIARALGRVLDDRVVVDRTGLAGQYDIAVMWTNGVARPAEEPESHRSETAEFPFTALEEQAGLKLQGARGLVDVLVIDHLQKPSEN